MGIVFFSIINIAILGGLAFGITRLLQNPNLPWVSPKASPTTTDPVFTATASTAPTLTHTIQPSSSPTRQSSDTPSAEPATTTPQPVATLTLNQGLIVLALDEGGNTHLFAYQPQESGAGTPLPLTRLTYGPWDDITPALSADGQTVAFASNRTGYWDIYLLTLSSGGITRLTDTPEYDGAPGWSPDDQWLVYETYHNDNLDIKIQSITTLSDTILLATDAAADFSPAWSPGHRQIAFVSNQSGEDEIWLADLDKAEEQRFQNISQSPNSRESHPAWSPDGKALAWVSEQDGIHELLLMKMASNGDTNPTPEFGSQENLGSGDWPVWSTDGETILTILEAPNQTYLTAYPTHHPGLALPTIELPGAVNGLTWGTIPLSAAIQTIYEQAAVVTSTPLYQTSTTAVPDDNGGRYQLMPLNNVQAAHPYLHDLVDDSFQALRTRIANEAGWDFLTSLENAYVPLTAPLEPGMGHDWLYTGRAIALNAQPMDAGWLVAVREDFSTGTYWRIYIKALYQDGSAGIPLHDQPWDFSARYNGDTVIYEQGGAWQAAIPEGYWIDFTERALSYGWERLPALSTWRASYPAARFNEFAFTGGEDWRTAMLELYPPEVMITPSPVIPPSRTPTATLRWYQSPTPTKTPTPRPTYTPAPETPTQSPTPGG
jgi:TolB protein